MLVPSRFVPCCRRIMRCNASVDDLNDLFYARRAGPHQANPSHPATWEQEGRLRESWNSKNMAAGQPEGASWRARGTPRAPYGSSFASGADGASYGCPILNNFQPKLGPKRGPISSEIRRRGRLKMA